MINTLNILSVIKDSEVHGKLEHVHSFRLLKNQGFRPRSNMCSSPVVRCKREVIGDRCWSRHRTGGVEPLAEFWLCDFMQN